MSVLLALSWAKLITAGVNLIEKPWPNWPWLRWSSSDSELQLSPCILSHLSSTTNTTNTTNTNTTTTTLGRMIPSAGQLAQQVLLAGSTLFTLNNYCVPSDTNCYPIPAHFHALNTSVHGRLIQPKVPDFDCINTECFTQDWRAEQAELAMFVNFETGFGTSSPSSTLPGIGRGRIPQYIVEAQTHSDVVHAVEFARRHNLRLRIKNTGHDYLGRSGEEGSFVVWTHRLKKTQFNPHFIPHGADHSVQPVPALIAESGVQVLDLYTAADKAGVIVTGGVSKSVGAAGGFSLGGGHGPLAPLHGLAVDNILEIEVVLATGAIVKASPYSHPDLFTALRGGGSAFGAVLSIAYKAHVPPKDGFVGLVGEFSVASNASEPDETWKGLLRQWVAVQPQLSEVGFAGYSYVRRNDDTPFAYVLPTSKTGTLDAAKEAFKPFLDFADAHPGVKIDYKFVHEDTWYKLWFGDFTTALDSLDAVGINLLLGSRLVPKTVVENNATALADYLAAAVSPSIVHLVAGGAVSKQPDFPASVNPAWRETLLHIDLPVSWAFNATLAQIEGMQKYLTAHTLALGQIAQFPNGVEASYPSESDWNEVEWQKIWYGEENYKTLIEAKKKYDPTGVFSGRKVPGSEFVGY
ncbi:FAD-binding domain-containing protein [Meredithblackwellia eburnea MCA 4105]